MQLALTLSEFCEHEARKDMRLRQASCGDRLSPLQREVIGIGRADARDGALVRGGGQLVDRLRGTAAVLTGRRRPTPLADPRLEALRRFAQRAALGREQITDIRVMRDAGYAASQIVAAARLARHPA